MTRLTKSEIERLLLSGNDVQWRDAAGKDQRLALTTAKSRRLLDYLLASDVRKPTGLPSTFVAGLSTAYGANEDPATNNTASPTNTTNAHSWRLKTVITEGFGGLNSWKGHPFRFNFNGKSLLLEGPNGSGKSSLVGAILWAISGERPRDQAEVRPSEMRPVFSANDEQAGEWPPIACYPPTPDDLNSPARVRVELTFQASDGSTAKVERTLDSGKVTSTIDPQFDIPSVLIETGLLMPARLAQLRLDEGRGRLTDAVQKLTGLDDLVSIGMLVEGLCHQSREYRSYRSKDLEIGRRKFHDALTVARDALAPVELEVPTFVPSDTTDDQGRMSTLGKQLAARATELTQVVSGDLADGLDLSNPKVQHQVIGIVAAVEEDLKVGIEGLDTWVSLQSIGQAFNSEASSKVRAALTKAVADSEEAARLLEKSTADPKFRLKAVAAKWHKEHRTGPVKNCPLCERGLQESPSLAEELEVLRSVGDAAARTFDDNVNAILANLEAATPTPMANIDAAILTLNPRIRLLEELRASFVLNERYDKYLVRFGALVDAALSNVPKNDPTPAEARPVLTGADVLDKVTKRMAILECLLALSDWFNTHSSDWKTWWRSLAEPGSESSEEEVSLENEVKDESAAGESLTALVSRLTDALATATPYRTAAGAMREAWSAGKTVAKIVLEVDQRQEIAGSLQPLKSLKPLCEAIAREAIDGLSGRISKLLDRIHLTEELRFQSTQLKRKEGLIVRGAFAPDLRIDATLVANSSWLRAVLWAFLFSLREEAVEQMEHDSFPLLAFDDPQSTFDAQH